jgi:hypothetical protein
VTAPGHDPVGRDVFDSAQIELALIGPVLGDVREACSIGRGYPLAAFAESTGITKYDGGSAAGYLEL